MARGTSIIDTGLSKLRLVVTFGAGQFRNEVSFGVHKTLESRAIHLHRMNAVGDDFAKSLIRHRKAPDVPRPE